MATCRVDFASPGASVGVGVATPARQPPQSGTVPGTTAQRDARGRAPPQVQARWRARRLGGGSPKPALAPRRGRQHDVPVRSVVLKLWNPCGAAVAGSGPSWLTAGGGALGATGERSVCTGVSVFQSPGPCAPKNVHFTVCKLHPSRNDFLKKGHPWSAAAGGTSAGHSRRQHPREGFASPSRLGF